MPDGTTRIRAPWQATPILEAIRIVADRHADVIVGATTRLTSCGNFVDAIGHLSNGKTFRGALEAAVATGLFYRDFDFTPR